MARRSRTATRMEKSHTESTGSSSPGVPSLFTFQLESGDEECQIKRIVFSGAGNNQGTAKIGLFQDTPTVSSFTDDKIIYSMALNSGAVALINETTTVRVPRDWHLAIMVSSNTATIDFTINTQLNYLVLS